MTTGPPYPVPHGPGGCSPFFLWTPWLRYRHSHLLWFLIWSTVVRFTWIYYYTCGVDCGWSACVLLRIPVRIGFNVDRNAVFFTSMRIRIRILVRLHSKKRLSSFMKVGNGLNNIGTYLRGTKTFLIGRTGSQVYWLIFVNFYAPWSGSAFPTRIQIRNSQINADLDPDPQQCFLFLLSPVKSFARNYYSTCSVKDLSLSGLSCLTRCNNLRQHLLSFKIP